MEEGSELFSELIQHSHDPNRVVIIGVTHVPGIRTFASHLQLESLTLGTDKEHRGLIAYFTMWNYSWVGISVPRDDIKTVLNLSSKYGIKLTNSALPVNISFTKPKEGSILATLGRTDSIETFLNSLKVSGLMSFESDHSVSRTPINGISVFFVDPTEYQDVPLSDVLEKLKIEDTTLLPWLDSVAGSHVITVIGTNNDGDMTLSELEKKCGAEAIESSLRLGCARIRHTKDPDGGLNGKCDCAERSCEHIVVEIPTYH